MKKSDEWIKAFIVGMAVMAWIVFVLPGVYRFIASRVSYEDHYIKISLENVQKHERELEERILGLLTDSNLPIRWYNLYRTDEFDGVDYDTFNRVINKLEDKNKIRWDGPFVTIARRLQHSLLSGIIDDYTAQLVTDPNIIRKEFEEEYGDYFYVKVDYPGVKLHKGVFRVKLTARDDAFISVSNDLLLDRMTNRMIRDLYKSQK